MTKHFDLLRSHQQKGLSSQAPKAGIPKQEAIDANAESSMSNPYSLKAAHKETAELPNHAHEQLIEEETLPHEIQEQPALSSSDLLIEEVEVETTTPLIATAAGAQSTLPESAENKINGFDFATWLQLISQDLSAIFQAAQEQQPTDTLQLNEHLRILFSLLERDNTTLGFLELEISRNIKSICNVDISVNDLVQKAIMMMLYTIKVGLQLKLQHQELLQNTVAAMLHHIGMAMVPDAIRHQTGKLSADEIKLIKNASKNAVRYLNSCDIDNNLLLLAAAQSSERFDGSGATGLSGHNIAWIARVIGLLSMFEALIHIRPYRQRLLPRDAIRELVNRHKRAFDPVILKALIESISLYPVGTFVQLNTGEIGQVITVHNKFPLRPIVHINMDKFGNAITEREINLKNQPNLMIQKCMYEEALENPAEQAL